MKAFKIIIIDIEGTTTSIHFVKDVLFKYALENVENYLRSNYAESLTQEVIDELRLQAESDRSNDKNSKIILIPPKCSGADDVIDAVVKNVIALMDADKKVKPLKKLQGFIWKDAYETGAIKGHVYDDVFPALEYWTKKGKDVYVYSSGSVQAQKLLFQYSKMGNLLKYFKGHFDTSVGSKLDSKSYENILKALEANPQEVVFITDIPGEAQAATETGMTAILSERSENRPLMAEDKDKYKVIHSFEELYVE